MALGSHFAQYQIECNRRVCSLRVHLGGHVDRQPHLEPHYELSETAVWKTRGHWHATKASFDEHRIVFHRRADPPNWP